MYHVIVLTVKKRKDSALELQKVLTKHGQIIRTRLGLHETGEEMHEGLIMLHVDACKESDDLLKELQNTPNINAQIVKIN